MLKTFHGLCIPISNTRPQNFIFQQKASNCAVRIASLYRTEKTILMQPYEQLLEKALEKVPKKVDTGERFVVPKSQIQPDGAKTIIVNFSEMAATLGRDEAHLLKFIHKELATSGDIKNKRATVLGRFNSPAVDKKIELYVSQYVICKECGRPDTHMVREDRMSFVKCDACGGKTFVKSINES